jgi:hypothetical protein
VLPLPLLLVSRVLRLTLRPARAAAVVAWLRRQLLVPRRPLAAAVCVHPLGSTALRRVVAAAGGIAADCLAERRVGASIASTRGLRGLGAVLLLLLLLLLRPMRLLLPLLLLQPLPRTHATSDVRPAPV